jgi:Uma2 family endonuclease
MIAYDRSVKIPLYARHSVCEVWLIDLQGNRISVHRNPQKGVYADLSTLDRPGTITPLMLPGTPIDLAGLL